MTAVLDPHPTPTLGVRAGAFGNATHLVCRACGSDAPLGPHYACLECFGPLEVGYAFGDVTREQIESGPRSIWRYAPLLPVPADIASFRSTDPGFTRLVDARHLADDLGLRSLWVKDDSGNPTHSFKDRVVAVALSAARAGIRSVVFVPQNLEQAKITASAIYGTTLVAVQGSYDDVNKLASEIAAEEEGWAFVNVNVRPYYAEGSKTLAFEIAEQLGWRLPDQIVIPVASGAQLTKIDKGFAELIKLGLVEDNPYVIFGARRTGGLVADVNDDAVVANIQRLARTEGIFAETAGGVTVGVAAKLVGEGVLDPAAETVVINSGDGLKTLDAIADKVGPKTTIPPRYDAFTEFWKDYRP